MIKLTAVPYAAMTVDGLRTLQKNLSVFNLSADLKPLPDAVTVLSDPHYVREAAAILLDAGMTLADARYDRHRSFRESFGSEAPLDTERLEVYLTMCGEDRI